MAPLAPLTAVVALITPFCRTLSPTRFTVPLSARISFSRVTSPEVLSGMVSGTVAPPTVL